MQIVRLEARALRCFDVVRFEPGPGLNLITGDNGAGKTSLLEAIHLMAYGRSFRGRVRDGLIRDAAAALDVFVEWSEGVPGMARHRRAGLRHSGHTWDGRLDGAALTQLGELCAALAVVTFEPSSHALIAGPSEGRRRFLDWGLFHVEPDFMPLWRRYGRALRQRNALLKVRAARSGDGELAAWEHELAESGEPISRHRIAYLERLQPHLEALTWDLAPSLGNATVTYQPGWRRDELTLADALLLARERDLAVGFTSVGPHRADWRIQHGTVPSREHLSRGQAKLAALTCLLAQAAAHAAHHSEWPVVLLDDLASELDQPHQARLLKVLWSSGAQVLITGTEPPAALNTPVATFHMEHGALHSPGR